MSARLGSKVHVDRSDHDVIDCSLTLSYCRLQIVVYSIAGHADDHPNEASWLEH